MSRTGQPTHVCTRNVLTGYGCKKYNCDYVLEESLRYYQKSEIKEREREYT
jgi:hypothetical protein